MFPAEDSENKKLSMNSENYDRFSGTKLGLFIFECIMALFYVAFSVILLFDLLPLLTHRIQEGFRIAFGIVLGIYGLYRIYIAYKKITQRNE